MDNQVDLGTCDGPSGGESRGSDAVQLSQIREEVATCLRDLQKIANLGANKLFVVGASSSEIAGFRIGSRTSLEIGGAVVDEVLKFQADVGCDVAFQCCEHLNRSLVVEQSVATRLGLPLVSAIPVPGAGGAVAAEAYFRFAQPCLVEQISADAGIDIGDTFIGMHLKRVAVPVRGTQPVVGSAHVTMATTRPPLVGGVRAVYELEEARKRLQGT